MSGGLFSPYRDATITHLRGLAYIALDDSGQVMRGSFASDSGGGGTFTYAAVGTYACRIDPIGQRSGEIANKIDERTTHVITLAPDTDVGTADRFRIGSTDYEITAVRTRTNEQVRELEAVVAA